MVKHLNAVLAEEIKARLWTGESQPTLASEFRTSQPQISRIKNGLSWGYIEWPDGSTGAMAEDREKMILAQRQPSAGTSQWGQRLTKRLDQEEDRLYAVERLLDSEDRMRAGGQIAPQTSIIDALLGTQKDKVASMLEGATGSDLAPPSLEDEIEALGQAAEVEADQELLDALRIPDAPKEKPVKKRKRRDEVVEEEPEEVVPEHMAWDEVLIRYGKVPLVKGANETENKELQLAIAIAALELPKSKFISGELTVYVHQILATLRGEN